jgi:site-specific recombinase XerD
MFCDNFRMLYICQKLNILTICNISTKKKISQASKVVLDDYFLDIKLANLKQKNIDYNLKIMIFVTLNVENDLDKITQRDIKLFQQKLQESNLGESTQKVYTVGFKRFLRWYSKNHYKNRCQYTLLLETSVKRKFNIPEKTPADLLTEHEIFDIIENGCKTARDKAIIAVFCRVRLPRW